MGLQGGDGLGGAVVTGNDLLEGVKQQVLALGIGLDLRQHKRQVHLKVAGTHTTCWAQ